MNIGQIRVDLAAVFDAVTGIAEVHAYPPDAVNVLPAAWIGDAQAAITMSSVETWTWSVPVTVAVSRIGLYPEERKATESLISAIMSQVRSSFTLGGTTFGLALQSAREGVVTVADVQYVAFTLVFSVKQKLNVTYTG